MKKQTAQGKTLVETKTYNTLFARIERIEGCGHQPDRCMFYYTHEKPDETHWTIIPTETLQQLRLLIAADDRGADGRLISNQTVGDLELFDVNLRVGPRVRLIDRVEISHEGDAP